MSLATRNPQVGIRLLCVLQQTFPPVLSQRLGERGEGSLWFSEKVYSRKKTKFLFNAIKEPAICIFCLQRRYPFNSQLIENPGLLKTLMDNGQYILKFFVGQSV